MTGRALWGRGWALASSWIYTVGIFVFARGMISAGLEGMPRRLFRAQAGYTSEAWELGGALTAIGGTLMFIGIMLFFMVIGITIVAGRKGGQPRDVPLSVTLLAPSLRGWERSLDRLWFWVVVAIVLILIAYGPFFLTFQGNFVSPGYRFF